MTIELFVKHWKAELRRCQREGKSRAVALKTFIRDKLLVATSLRQEVEGPRHSSDKGRRTIASAETCE